MRPTDPAFPRPYSKNDYGDHPVEVPEQRGMDVRTWLAATVTLQNDSSDGIDGYSPKTLVMLVGSDRPKSNTVELVQWYAAAEAAIRVIKADALIARLSR